MTIRQVQKSALQFLPHNSDHVLSVEVLLAFVMGCSREELFVHPERPVPPESQKLFTEMVARYREGEPVAYLTGVKEFYGLNFIVDRRVLIPRPETEHLVDEVLDFAGREKNDSFALLDVGTGSGCIALTLALKLPHAKVTAVDVSSDALEVARKNAAQFGNVPNVRFLQSDLLSSVEGPFDVIVANLPYIGEEKFRFVSKEALDYEPHVALFGGSDGLKLYERLFEQLAALSWRPRLLVGEFGFLQSEAVEDLLERFFPKKWQIKKDYASIDRMFVVGFPPDV